MTELVEPRLLSLASQKLEYNSFKTSSLLRHRYFSIAMYESIYWERNNGATRTEAIEASVTKISIYHF